MILNIQQTRGFVDFSMYDVPWNQQFCDDIVKSGRSIKNNDTYRDYQYTSSQQINKFINNIDKHNKRTIKQHKKQPSYTPKPLINISLTQTQHQQNNSIYTDYSNFIPIRNSIYSNKNQYINQYKYLQYAYDGQYQESITQFHQCIKNGCKFLNQQKQKKQYKQEKTDIQKYGYDSNGCVLEKRLRYKKYAQCVNMLSRYKLNINFTSKIYLYVLILQKGTIILRKYNNIHKTNTNINNYHIFLSDLSKTYQQFLPTITKSNNNNTNKPNDNQNNITNNLRQNISLSIDKKYDININSMSYKMKKIYCSLCHVYECQQHDILQSLLYCGNDSDANRKNQNINRNSGRYINKKEDISYIQYVSNKNKIPKQQHIQYAIKMLKNNNSYLALQYQQQQNLNIHPCSQQCYLSHKPTTQNTQLKQTLQILNISQLSKCIIQIGIHLYSYQPCLISRLFQTENVKYKNENNKNIDDIRKIKISCRIIYRYIQSQFCLEAKIGWKMYEGQVGLLKNQSGQSEIYDKNNNMLLKKHKLKCKKSKTTTVKSIKNKSTTQLKKQKIKNAKNTLQTQCISSTPSQNQQLSQISICSHHHLYNATQDQLCSNCICATRGYCLPSCLCSQMCPIMMIGCKCNSNSRGKGKGKGKKNQNGDIGNEGGCFSLSCPCFQKGVQCVPGICGKYCFQLCKDKNNHGNNKSKEKTGCLNTQIQLRKYKNLKIGKSLIPQAGLGLFTIQPIYKDSLVTVYLGQQIQPQAQQIRDILRKNNTFYNFQLNQIYLDSRYIGNKSRFINHSSQKSQINLKVRIVKSMYKFWIAFYAMRNIDQNQELYFDYDGDGELSKHHGQKYPFIKHKQ